MFQKIFTSGVCMFPEANTIGRKIACGLAGAAATGTTFYALRLGYKKFDKWQESRPAAPIVAKTELERKRSNAISIIPFSVLGLVGGSFAGAFVINDCAEWCKYIRGSRACCDIIRSTSFFTMRIPVYGFFIGICAYPTYDLYNSWKVYQQERNKNK